MKKLLFFILIFLLFGITVYAQNNIDMNTASYVQDDDWIYYWNSYNNTLSKVKIDGTNNTEVLKNYGGGSWFHHADICYDDKYIYCSGGYVYNTQVFNIDGKAYTHDTYADGIYRISKTDSKAELIYKCELDVYIREICYIYKDRLTFVDDKDNIYSIKTDGTDLMKIDNTLSNCYVGEKGVLYYSDYENPGIYKIDITGQNKQKISDNKTYYMVVENDWIYYDNRSDDGKLYKMKIDGTENVKINNDDCYFETISDGWIYYASGQEGFSICRINGQTLEKQTLVPEGYDNLNVANGYLFYSYLGEMYMVNINGGRPTEAILDKSLFGTSEDFELLVEGGRFEVNKGEIPPMIIDGSVYVPLSAFTDKFDIDTTWDKKSQTVTFEKPETYGDYMEFTNVQLTVGSNIMKVTRTNSKVTEKYDESTKKILRTKSDTIILVNKEIGLDVPIHMINNSLMVPLRAVAEALHYKVSWHEDTKTAHLFGTGVE